MSHDFNEWFAENKPPYTKDPIYLSNITYTKQFVEDAWYNGYEQGCNKVNEWHNLEENPNDLPIENMKQVMIMTNFKEYLMGWYSHISKAWWSSECPDPDDRIECDNIKVIKWKEIVPPKEEVNE